MATFMHDVKTKHGEVYSQEYGQQSSYPYSRVNNHQKYIQCCSGKNLHTTFDIQFPVPCTLYLLIRKVLIDFFFERIEKNICVFIDHYFFWLSDNLNAYGIHAFLSTLSFKLHTVVIFDLIDQTAFVYKNVRASITWGNESKAFRHVKEFYYSFFHN